MTKASSHKWEFRERFRRHAFGWRSQPAIKRVHGELITSAESGGDPLWDRFKHRVDQAP